MRKISHLAGIGLFAAVLGWLNPANANGLPYEPPAPAPEPVAPTQQQGQQQGQRQGQYMSIDGVSASANNSMYSTSRNFGLSVAPSAAAALPSGMCPQGDSLAWSVGWNFVSYASSKTRTEMECLDKVLAAIRQPHAVPVFVPTPIVPAPVTTILWIAHDHPAVQRPPVVAAKPATKRKPAQRAQWPMCVSALPVCKP